MAKLASERNQMCHELRVLEFLTSVPEALVAAVLVLANVSDRPGAAVVRDSVADFRASVAPRKRPLPKQRITHIRRGSDSARTDFGKRRHGFSRSAQEPSC